MKKILAIISLLIIICLFFYDKINTNDKKNNNFLTTYELKNSFSNYYINKDNLLGFNNKNLYDIDISKNNESKIFNFLENANIIIPYKDTFLTFKEDFIALYQKDKFIDFKKMSINNYIYEAFIYFPDNTFIFVEDKDINTNFIYDVNKNKLTKIEDTYYIYENGYFYINGNNILFYDLKKDKKIEYNTSFELSNYNIITATSDNKQLILYNDNYLTIINLENEILIDKIKIDFKINNIKTNNNKIYLINNNSILLLDLNKVNSKEINLKDNEEKKIYTLKENLEKNYNINIHIKNDTNIKFPDFTAEINSDNSLIYNALISIESILKKFNSAFFNTFNIDNKDGLNFYLVGSLAPKNEEMTITPAAYSLFYDNKYMIVMDITELDLSKVICHEIMHNIEINAIQLNKNLLSEWNNLNPSNFMYYNVYTNNTTDTYTLIESDINSIYFTDSYAKTYEAEDKARIFEEICSCEKSELTNYPNLYKKAIYLKEEILNNYGILKDSTLFNSLY